MHRRCKVYQVLKQPEKARDALEHGLQVLNTYYQKNPDKEILEDIQKLKNTLTELQK